MKREKVNVVPVERAKEVSFFSAVTFLLTCFTFTLENKKEREKRKDSNVSCCVTVEQERKRKQKGIRFKYFHSKPFECFTCNSNPHHVRASMGTFQKEMRGNKERKKERKKEGNKKEKRGRRRFSGHFKERIFATFFFFHLPFFFNHMLLIELCLP